MVVNRQDGTGCVLGRGEDLRDRIREMKPQLEMLPARDRILLELVPSGERSVREVARLLGVNPGWLSRRYRVMLRRLGDPMVGVVMARGCTLPMELREMAVERWLLGMTTGAIAEKHRVVRTRVTEGLAFVRGYARGAGLVVAEVSMGVRAERCGAEGGGDS